MVCNHNRNQDNFNMTGRKVARKLAFEVYFNDILIHSQINSKVMPNFEAVAVKAQEYLSDPDSKIEPIEETEDCICRFQSCCYVSWFFMTENVKIHCERHFLDVQMTIKFEINSMISTT